MLDMAMSMAQFALDSGTTKWFAPAITSEIPAALEAYCCALQGHEFNNTVNFSVLGGMHVAFYRRLF